MNIVEYRAGWKYRGLYAAWMRKTSATVAAGALAAVLAGPACANILTNGSFENTANFSPDSTDTTFLTSGSTSLTGWTVADNTVAWEGPTNPYGVYAVDGSYYLDLQGYSDVAPYGGVTQTIATILGASYQLSYDLGGSLNYDFAHSDAISACAGATCGAASMTAAANDVWISETLDFTATGASTLISLTGSSPSGYPIAYIGLDNVSVIETSPPPVSPVPEPASFALLGSALLGVGAIRRRR